MFGIYGWKLEVLVMCLADAEDDYDQSGTLEERLLRRMRGAAHPRLSAREWKELSRRVLYLNRETELPKLVEALQRERA